ncbi:ATP-binding protein [Nannocystis radixulma]|uniref:histidine kinase n=1 Tax=Nannocystis radixulma TaxID=2995305 RepID=A0ABT5AZ01_9BACT|nr:ATP-binding protein [Nannocystis radixulma]MDC0667063.1 ATP-binding protein [Nannocystis radixulma]
MSVRPPLLLRQHVWRAFLRVALLPLLLVEIALIAVYLLANVAATQENLAAVREIADAELARIAAHKATIVDGQLAGVRQMTALYARQTQEALARAYELTPEQRATYKTSPQGVFYTEPGAAGSSVYYSAATKIGPAERDKCERTAQLDPLMRDILASNSLIVQLYFNTFDSMNRILPAVDSLAQYGTAMDIPSYNFYYEADAKHNPRREAVWTDAYVDPAGQGWMVSCIAPVYRGDFLEGVVGLDITTATIIAEALDLQLPWSGYGALLGKDGTLLALPPAGEEDWGVRELTAHSYTEHITHDTFKPDDFNLWKRADLAELAAKIAASPHGVAPIDLKGPKLVAWATAVQTGWTLLIVVPEHDIYAQVTSLGNRLFRIGGWMVFGLVAFYCVFLWFVARRARQISAEVVTPLLAIDGLVRRIGAGEYRVEPPPIVIAELDASAHGVAAMGRQLGAAHHEAEVARDSAQRASQLKSEFLATMSHELRTPLNIVIGMNELLREEVVDQEQRQCTEAIDSAGRDLLRIVEDILDLSRIEAGQIELAVGSYDPAALIESVAVLLTPQARARGLHLAVTVDPSIPAAIAGDEGRVRQVLFNLVGNAIKFTPRGDVVVRAQLVESRLRIEVEDTGIGIPEQARERMFQLFTQVDGSYARRHGGTGLGLSVCKKLVDLMGGAIGYDSEEGAGSLFWFELPLSEAPAAPEILPFSHVRARLVGASSPSRDALMSTLHRLGVVALRARDVAGLSAADADVFFMERDAEPPLAAVAVILGEGTPPWGFAATLAEPFTREAVCAVLSTVVRTPARQTS